MKLYSYQPKGHGPASFFVMSEDADSAAESINRYITQMSKDPMIGCNYKGLSFLPSDLSCNGAGEVLENDNQ